MPENIKTELSFLTTELFKTGNKKKKVQLILLYLRFLALQNYFCIRAEKVILLYYTVLIQDPLLATQTCSETPILRLKQQRPQFCEERLRALPHIQITAREKPAMALSLIFKH